MFHLIMLLLKWDVTSVTHDNIKTVIFYVKCIFNIYLLCTYNILENLSNRSIFCQTHNYLRWYHQLDYILIIMKT